MLFPQQQGTILTIPGSMPPTSTLTTMTLMTVAYIYDLRAGCCAEIYSLLYLCQLLSDALLSPPFLH